MKNVVVCIFIISFVFGYSQSKDTNIKIIKNPLYNLEIKAFHCSIELWINDILVFNHYEEKGSVWVDWPINQFILQKGNQNFEVRIIPYKNQTTLSEKVEVEFGIHAIEAITESERIEVIERSVINIPNKEKLPLYIHKGTFLATTPYVLEGWKNSQDLSKEDKKLLYQELIKWNSKLLNIYSTSNLEQYNSVYKQRELEFDIANYVLSEPNNMDVFHSKFKDLIAYEFTQSDMLSFNGNNLTGSVDENSSTYSGQNNVKLLVNENQQIVQGYQLQTYTEKESIILSNLIKDKLGNPNYDDDDKINRHIVWEIQNATYIFNISYQSKINSVKTVETVLYVINNDLEKLVFHLNSITYYESYLIERKKQNKVFANYSYSIFAKEQQDNGTDYYLKGTKGIKSK